MNPSNPTPDTSLDARAALNADERQRCEVWTRVMGYHRPVASFNIGKRGEFEQRTCFEQSPRRA